MSTSALHPSPESGRDVAPDSRFAREVAGNICMAILFLSFAVANGRAFAATLQISSLLLLIKVSIDIVCYLIRRVPLDVSVSPYDWLIGMGGTYLVVLFRPAAGSVEPLIGSVLQITGLTLQILGMISLNRSIGVVAANRGIKTTGMYRLVRHPLYLSYTISFGGYVLCQTSSWNVLVYSAALMLWVLRIYAEERLLLRSTDYQAYAQKTRWRMVPGLF